MMEYNELMERISFSKGNQSKFVVDIKGVLGINWSDLSKILKVSGRTLFDWKREKYKLTKVAFNKCLELNEGKIKVPNYKVLPTFWNIKKAARLGGIATFKKYGGPGTPNGRKKGGMISQQKRKLYPELYAHCNLRKIISEPQNSVFLAEFIGIMLGDGGINSDTQAIITLHKKDAKDYIVFVCNLIKRLFSIKAAVYHPHSEKQKNVASITISSTSLVDFLISKGLKKGNKVTHQVGVPDWIISDKNFCRACLCGLIDTDGCVYSHKHKSHGINYFNFGLNFSNKSVPLLEFVFDTLINLNLHPKIFSKGVNLYREPEVLRYVKEVGFNNSYHKDRLKSFLKKKYN